MEYTKDYSKLFLLIFILSILSFGYTSVSYADFDGKKIATHGYHGNEEDIKYAEDIVSQKAIESTELREIEELSQIIEEAEQKEDALKKGTIDDVNQIITDYINTVERDVHNEPEEDIILNQLSAEEKRAIETFRNVVEEEKDTLESNIREGDVEGVERSKKKIINAVSESLGEVDNIISDDRKETFMEKIEEAVDKLENAVVEKDRTIKERVGLELFRDSDNDGVSDYDEINVYGTNPEEFDTDGDGVGDGLEVRGGFNPKSSDNKKITYDDPREFIDHTVKNVFFVDSIEVVETKKDLEGNTDAKKIKIKGRALPNSYVTLYIYSTPIIVTVRADNNGVWTYTIDEELSDGSHEIYVAQTDGSGKILAQSDSIPFVKQAAAIEFTSGIIPTLESANPSFYSVETLLVVLVILVVVLVIAFLIVGILHRRHRQHYKNMLFEGKEETEENNV